MAAVDGTGPARPAGPGEASEVVPDARGLTRRYGDLLAVDDVSFSLVAGEIVGPLGPNGAGKTTVMRDAHDDAHAHGAGC